MMTVKEDHRVFERFSIRFPARFKHKDKDFGTRVFVRDASGEGFRIISKEQLFVRDSVSLEIKLPDGHEPLTLNGRVVWTKNPSPTLWEAGLQFHKVQLIKLHRIVRLLEP